jgi:uncharacterized membrane protein
MTRRPLIAAGLLMGAGLGGFIDGIVFHQILQLHNMLSAQVPTNTLLGAKINMFWDGVFHAGVWVLTAWGLKMLWSAGARADVPWSGRTFSGSLFMGWGVFNLVEGIIDHHVLRIHHVVERLSLSLFDYAFLASGVLLILLGVVLAQTGRGEAAPRASTSTERAGRREG